MDWLILKIDELAKLYGPWGVFLVSILEEIVAPIPSSLTLMGAGAIILAPFATISEVILPAFFLVAIPAALGVTVGAVFLYGIAYWGEKMIFNSWGGWFGITERGLKKMQRYFQSGNADEIILFLLRVTPIFPNSVISVVCGLIQYPFKTYLIISFVGAIPRALFFALLGWWLGNTYYKYVGIFTGTEQYLLWAIVVLGFVGAMTFWIKRRKKYHASSRSGR